MARFLESEPKSQNRLKPVLAITVLLAVLLLLRLAVTLLLLAVTLLLLLLLRRLATLALAHLLH